MTDEENNKVVPIELTDKGKEVDVSPGLAFDNSTGLPEISEEQGLAAFGKSKKMMSAAVCIMYSIGLGIAFGIHFGGSKHAYKSRIASVKAMDG